MSTLAGGYVREPSDFATVATEAALIQIADDPSSPVVHDTVTAWADLSSEQEAAVKSVIEPIIIRKEGIINGYLRSGGYQTPVNPDRTPLVVDYAVRLTWNDLRYRKQQTTDDDYSKANADIFKQLQQIADGSIQLDAAVTVVTPDAPSGAVHAFSSAERVFSRKTMEDF